MKPVFPRINNAIRFTIEYYTAARVYAHYERFSKKSRIIVTPDTLDTYYDLVLTCHSQMEDEIYQVINTTNENTQVYVFEELDLWLQDVRINSVNESWLLNEIDIYNDKINERFTKDIEKQELEFINSSEYYREHNTEYEATVRNYLGVFPGNFLPSKVKTIKHSKFFCVETQPELIDWNNDFRQYYLNLLHKIITSFKNVLSPLIERYKGGKILPSASIFAEKQKLLESDNRDEIVKPHIKIKVDLTVTQLAYLFKLLQESYLINEASNLQLFRLISQNFSTKEAENISIHSLRKKFYLDELSDEKINVDAFWLGKLTKWIEKIIPRKNQNV